MTPFLEQLGAIVALVLALASVGAMIWGAATRQRGRQAVDEQHAGKLNSLTASSAGHALSCDETHGSTREELEQLRTRATTLELTAASKAEINALSSRVSAIEGQL